MASILDLSNQRFGRLTVLEITGQRYHGNVCWRCECECGQQIVVPGNRLRSGHTKSCGCISCDNRDLLGQRFGRLVVVEQVERPEGRTTKGLWWKCECDCGNTHVVVGAWLRNGNTQSCGCLQREQASKASRLPAGVSAKNRLLRTYKRAAEKRDLEWSLSDKEFFDLVSKRCNYCGNYPSQVVREKGGDFWYNGLDRLDSTEGYVLGNIRACCWTCNKAKGTMTPGEFIRMCEKVAERMHTCIGS